MIGTASNTGGKKRNEELAKKRAANVRAALVAAGVNIPKLSPGEQEQVVLNPFGEKGEQKIARKALFLCHVADPAGPAGPQGPKGDTGPAGPKS